MSWSVGEFEGWAVGWRRSVVEVACPASLEPMMPVDVRSHGDLRCLRRRVGHPIWVTRRRAHARAPRPGPLSGEPRPRGLRGGPSAAGAAPVAGGRERGPREAGGRGRVLEARVGDGASAHSRTGGGSGGGPAEPAPADGAVPSGREGEGQTLAGAGESDRPTRERGSQEARPQERAPCREPAEAEARPLPPEPLPSGPGGEAELPGLWRLAGGPAASAPAGGGPPGARGSVTDVTLEAATCPKCKVDLTTLNPYTGSAASGAASVQIGPRILALSALLHHERAVPMEAVSELVRALTGLDPRRARWCAGCTHSRGEAPLRSSGVGTSSGRPDRGWQTGRSRPTWRFWRRSSRAGT